MATDNPCFVRWFVARMLFVGAAAACSVHGSRGAGQPGREEPPDVSLRMAGSTLQLVFEDGVPRDGHVTITSASRTIRQALPDEGGGPQVVSLNVPPTVLPEALSANRPTGIALDSPDLKARWAVEPIVAFGSRQKRPPTPSGTGPDTRSTGTLEIGAESATARLSFAGVNNNYVVFPLVQPIPDDAVEIGGFYRPDPSNSIPVMLSFRLTDRRGEIFGYFLPVDDGADLVMRPIAGFSYRFGVQPAGSGPPVRPLSLSALLFESTDHKLTGPAAATITDLFAVRLLEFHRSPGAPRLRPSMLTADFALPERAVHSMSGFLHACDATEPPDDRITPLHPALWRIGFAWLKNRDRIERLGIPTRMVLSDTWGPQYPADSAAWEAHVRKIAGESRGLDLAWDIWNEPDQSMFWKGTESQLFETFAQAARALRSELAPGTAISGPSLSHYDRDYLARFVDFCKAKNVHLNVLSWHELAVDDNIPSIAEHLREARHLFVENSVYRSVGIERIEINEIIGPSAQYRPGEILGYFAALEKGGADGACKACWGDARGGSNCTNDTLDGILTPDTHEPRAAWWAYKAYADSIAGRVQANSSDPRLAVFASGSAAAGTAQVLVGCYPCPGLSTPNMGLAIRIQNLSRILGKARRAHVKVERLPDSGEKPLLAPEKGLEEDVALSSGGLTAAIPALALHEAYLVTISRLPG